MSLSLERYTKGHSRVGHILRTRIKEEREGHVKVVAEKGDCIFPEDLIVEILSRLGVRTLQQFKSVCKSWYTIISSSEFVSKHLQHYYDKDKNWRDGLLVQYDIDSKAGNGLVDYELLVDEKSRSVLSYEVIKTPEYNAYMCGPCHGLYYLWHDTPPDFRRKGSLWNPALNEFYYLPDIISKPNVPSNLGSFEVAHGFGFDSKTKDYKVIAIQGYVDNSYPNNKYIDYPLSVFIYSIKSSSWRYWGDLRKTYYLERNEAYTFVNQCHYWLGCRHPWLFDYTVMISFDISVEAYKEIPLPKFKEIPDCSSQLVVYQECIAFVSVAKSHTKLFIWTWSDEVWTRKITMEFEFRVWGAFCHCWDNMLVCRQQGRRNLVLCDTNTKEVRVIEYADSPPESGLPLNICVYKESLVSLKEFMTNTR